MNFEQAEITSRISASDENRGYQVGSRRSVAVKTSSDNRTTECCSACRQFCD